MDIQARAKNIRAIFFDIDGTLFSNETKIVPPSALKAIEAARSRDILIFAATGRHRQQVEDVSVLADINFDGYVTLNGQYCCTRYAEVYKNPINTSDIRQLAEYAERTGTACLLLEANDLYVNIVNDTVLKVHEMVRSKVPEVRDISRAFEREILQAGFYLPDDDIPEVLTRLEGCTYTKWIKNGVDIIPLGASKWIGIEKMLEHFGLTPEQAMAFGDNDNDIEMLKNSGISVAMGNAGDDVKAIADYVTDDVDRDGIYKAMAEIFNWT